MPGWRRLRAIPGVGPWTLEVLALYGQGRFDRVPAGDLGYLKLVGRITTGHPKARVDVPEARAFFEPYGEWKGLAGEYLRLAASSGLLPEFKLRRTGTDYVGRPHESRSPDPCASPSPSSSAPPLLAS
jgi:hypothetical protein